VKVHSSCVFVLCLAGIAGCSGDSSPSAPGGGGGSTTLSAPAQSSPDDAAQLTTLRPTFVVTNVASSQSGARTYEFQLSDRSDFSPSGSAAAGFIVAASRAGVPEGSGTTSFTPDSDLQPATRMYWRSRVSQGSSTSEWSPTRSFNTQIVGYNRPGELYDPLTTSATLGRPVGSTTFIPGRGIQINSESSYVWYQLAQTIVNGEMSVEIEGLYGDGPGAKLKLFSMFDGTGNLYASKYLFNVQYRGGLDGNPNNSISFKALYGDSDWKYEPDFGQRSASVMSLSPARTYFWRAIWGSSVRVVLQDGRGGPTLYDLSIAAPNGTYAPNPHYAYLGANGPISEETGSWPGAIYRNLWIGTAARPATLGTALTDSQPY
jgi:hypothetical protein